MGTHHDCSSPLPPYSGSEPICVKCGWNIITTTYAPAWQSMNSRSGDTYTHKKERLVRRCSVCGYSWDEATVDGQS